MTAHNPLIKTLIAMILISYGISVPLLESSVNANGDSRVINASSGITSMGANIDTKEEENNISLKNTSDKSNSNGIEKAVDHINGKGTKVDTNNPISHIGKNAKPSIDTEVEVEVELPNGKKEVNKPKSNGTKNTKSSNIDTKGGKTTVKDANDPKTSEKETKSNKPLVKETKSKDTGNANPPETKIVNNDFSVIDGLSKVSTENSDKSSGGKDEVSPISKERYEFEKMVKEQVKNWTPEFKERFETVYKEDFEDKKQEIKEREEHDFKSRVRKKLFKVLIKSNDEIQREKKNFKKNFNKDYDVIANDLKEKWKSEVAVKREKILKELEIRVAAEIKLKRERDLEKLKKEYQGTQDRNNSKHYEEKERETNKRYDEKYKQLIEKGLRKFDAEEKDLWDLNEKEFKFKHILDNDVAPTGPEGIAKAQGLYKLYNYYVKEAKEAKEKEGKVKEKKVEQEIFKWEKEHFTELVNKQNEYVKKELESRKEKQKNIKKAELERNLKGNKETLEINKAANTKFGRISGNLKKQNLKMGRESAKNKSKNVIQRQ